MPIYEYECGSCHNVIEVTQSISEEPLTTCPDCSGTLKKIISMSAFHLKGGGWYADGYSSNSTKCGKSAGTCTYNGSKTPASHSEQGKSSAVTNHAPKKESNTSCNGCKASASASLSSG